MKNKSSNIHNVDLNLLWDKELEKKRGFFLQILKLKSSMI